MDRRRAAGVLLALAACVAYATAAPTASNHTSLDLYDGAPDGCYYNFQHYGEGDRIMTNEPCLNCTCHNRMLMCYLRVCPFTKPIGQDCTIEKRADQCCPIVTCPDVPVDLLTSTTTSPAEYGSTGLGKLDKYGCSIHGKYFPEGSKVPPTPNKPCEHCYCIRNMTTCVMQECTLHVDGCTPIYHKDVCCPVRYSCDHPEDEMPLLDDLSTTVRPTPGFLLTTTTLSPVTQMSQDCLYENQVIRDGALIKTEKACDHCYCMKGDIVCVVQECGTPMENEGKNCTALAPREGVCCPDTYICEGDEPTTGTYETDYTTELEKLTTLTPPRRAGSEGSGYRNEPDGVSDAETETEGSGYEQVTIHPTIVTEAPESHKIETSEEMLSTTVKESDDSDVITESDLQKDTESQHYIPSTTNAYTSQVDESLSTKAQDEEIGSGEEDIVTPYETVPTSSSPIEESSEPTVSNEQNAVTTDSTKEIDSEIHVKLTTTGTPTEDEYRTDIPKEQNVPTTTVTPTEDESRTDIPKEQNVPTTTGTPTEDENRTDIPKEQNVPTDGNVFDFTTHRPLNEDEDVETSTTFDDEHDSLRTTSIPIVEDNENKTSASPEQDKETFEPHYYATPSTSAPGLEDEIATTESQDTAIDSFDGTVPEFDVHHQVTMTASTPLLEEIEKDTTDQEIIRDESTPSEGKISTIASNIPTEESISKDSLMPDPIDETIAINIPTTVSTFEDVKTTSDDQKTKDTDYEDSSEPQQYSPTTVASVSDDETENTISVDSGTTSKSQESQETNANENSEHQYASTDSAPVLEDKITEITSLHDMTTSKFDEINVEHSSEPQQYFPTTSGPRLDDSTKDITEIDVTEGEENSEPQEYGPTTNGAIFDDATKISTPSDTMTSSQEGQETSIGEGSEPQQHASTTRRPLIDDETRVTTYKTSEGQETTLHNLPTTNAPMSDDEIKISTTMVLDKDTTDISETLSTTNAPVFENENRKTSPSDASTTSEAQEGLKVDIDDSSEPNKYASATSASVYEDEAKRTTKPEVFTTSKDLEDQKTDVDDSSEYAPTTSGQIFDDESKITTPSDSMITTKTQDIQESDLNDTSDSQNYAPTTSAPTFKDESKATSSSDSKESTTMAPMFEEKPKETISTTFEQNEITTTEPDKGLNTIPSGSVEEETTESSGIAKHTHTDELIPTESATELGNKLYDVTEVAAEHSTLDTSASPDDLSTQTTESTVKENINKISSTETHDITEQTTAVPIDIIEEALSTLTYDHQPSTKLPASEYQDSSTTTLPLNTEADSEKPVITISSYEYSPQTTSSQSSQDSQTETSSPSYTVPVSTVADLEENEISNESRIPGEGDCLLNGVTYRNESAVPSSNKCQSGCRCSSSIIKCDPIICSPPPEYMDNCQTTYDSPDSCCPTYVCDHKTETMPPQSHSQMSGTEAPVDSPIKCAGDECILTEDKNNTVATSKPCDSGSCTGQVESDTYPTNIPKQPTEPSVSDECNQENGCQASPVKPCEGTDCEFSSEVTPPQHQQPCNGDNCDIPIKDCSTGKCGDENKHNIETECTEESCVKKEDSETEQKPPKKCSGSECQLTETTSEIELTTVGSLVTGTEKMEQSSKLPATEADLSATDKSDEHVTEAIVISESQSTTVLPSESTKLPDQYYDKDHISTSSGLTTPSEHEESSVPDFTKVNDESNTESPTISPNVYITDKLEYDVTTTASKLHTENPDLTPGEKSTVEVSSEITTAPPKTHAGEFEEFTKVPSVNDSQDTTLTSQEQYTTQPPEKQVPEDTTSISEEITTKIPITEEANNDANTELPSAPDSMQHESTKLPLDTNEDATVKYDSEEVTELLQVSEEATTQASHTTAETYDSHSQDTTIASEDSTTQADIIGTEISKPHSTDLQETTEIPKYSQSDETSAKTTNELATQTEISVTTISSQASIEIETESSKPDESHKTQDTQSPDTTQTEMTMIEDAKTESLSEGDVPNVTESSEETTSGTDEEMSTPTIKPTQKTENVEFTKISTVTEPSLVSETEPTKDDEISQGTVASQQDTEGFTKIMDDAVTESFKPDEPEFVSTTKSSLADSDSQGTTTKVAIGTDIKSTKSDEKELQAVTQPTESVSISLLDVTTIQPSEDDQKLFSEPDVQENTTLHPVIIPELTTQSILESDSKISETEKTVINEITTEIQEATQPITDSATESLEKATSISSVSTSDGEDDLTSITDHEITTESSLDLVTIPVSHSEVTTSSGKPGELDETTPTEIRIDSSTQSITELPIEQESETAAEDAKTQVPDVLETEKDTIPKQTTSKPSDTTDLSHNVDKQPEHIDSHEEQPLETSDKPADRITTESPHVIETKQPLDLEIDSESQTDKPFIHQDEPKSEPPLSNEITTVIFEEKITENPKDIVEEPETTHYHEINTKPTESKEDAYTEIPMHVSLDGEATNKPYQIDDELTTAAIQISEQTSESANVFTNAPTESSGAQNVDTEITQKEPLDIEVTQQTETTPGIDGSQDKETQTQESLDSDITQQAETTPGIVDSQDKETQTLVPDLSFEQESTKEQLPTDMVKLTTESPKDSYTEPLVESITTEKPDHTETVTEFVEVTKDEKEKTPEEEEFKPSPAITVSEEQITTVQDQDNRDSISTEKSITTESIIFESTKVQTPTETSTMLSDMITSHLGEAVEPSTPKYELSESTTISKVDEEIVHVNKETTEIPTTVSNQPTIGIVTELEPDLIDTTTKEQLEVSIPFETERPEMYPTTISATEEPAKLTPSPTEEASAGSDLPTSSEPHAAEEEKLTTSIALDVEKASTPKSSEIEVQTEKVTTPTESPFQSETTPKEEKQTTAPEEDKQTIAPEEEKQTTAPEKEKQTTAPEEEKQTTAPEEDKQTTAPEEEKQTTAPEEEKQTTAREEEKQTTAKAEEFTTAYPVFDKFTKPTLKPTDAPVTEQPKPIPTEEQPTDDILPPDDESSVPPSGTSGYGTDPDYMEEDQTFGPGTCRYGGKVYVSAQQIPRDDPCDFCFCFRSDIICLQQSCPPPIHGCHEEPISGFCCPRYECPVSMATTVNVTTTTTTTTTTLPPHFPVHSYKGSAQKRGCLIKGHTYKVGEVVRASSGPCLHCTCGGDGQMKCDPKQCTPEPMLRQMIAAAVSAKRRR